MMEPPDDSRMKQAVVVNKKIHICSIYMISSILYHFVNQNTYTHMYI